MRPNEPRFHGLFLSVRTRILSSYNRLTSDPIGSVRKNVQRRARNHASEPLYIISKHHAHTVYSKGRSYRRKITHHQPQRPSQRDKPTQSLTYYKAATPLNVTVQCTCVSQRTFTGIYCQIAHLRKNDFGSSL